MLKKFAARHGQNLRTGPCKITPISLSYKGFSQNHRDRFQYSQMNMRLLALLSIGAAVYIKNRDVNDDCYNDKYGGVLSLM